MQLFLLREIKCTLKNDSFLCNNSFDIAIDLTTLFNSLQFEMSDVLYAFKLINLINSKEIQVNTIIAIKN